VIRGTESKHAKLLEVMRGLGLAQSSIDDIELDFTNLNTENAQLVQASPCNNNIDPGLVWSSASTVKPLHAILNGSKAESGLTKPCDVGGNPKCRKSGINKKMPR
jgi:hypothetical protein